MYTDVYQFIIVLHASQFFMEQEKAEHDMRIYCMVMNDILFLSTMK